MIYFEIKGSLRIIFRQGLREIQLVRTESDNKINTAASLCISESIKHFLPPDMFSIFLTSSVFNIQSCDIVVAGQA